MKWTTGEDIIAKVRRRWKDGSLLAALARGEPFPVVEVPIRGPVAGELGDGFEAARSWVADLDAGQRDGGCYRLVWGDIGGRLFGRNRLPKRAVVETYGQAWALLRVGTAVKRFETILDQARQSGGPVVDWLVAHPHKGLELADEWPTLLAAYRWLDANRGSGHYLREISAPGVDTKFAERHRGVLAQMLDVSGSAAGFTAGLGLSSKPEMIRFRAAPGLGLTESLTEMVVRADELSRLDLRPTSALIVENEITYLSVPLPATGVVVWGKGFEVDRVGRLPWLADIPIDYWGDLDTYGFAILDRLRDWLPQARSLLMDRDTLLTHRDRWVREDRPATMALTRLTRTERDLYDDLVTDRYGVKVRLEQERIDWGWVRDRLATHATMVE